MVFSLAFPHSQDEDGLSPMAGLRTDEGFVVLISTLDIDSKNGPAQPNVCLQQLEGFKPQEKKKKLRLQTASPSIPNSFEIGKNHLLPYSFPLSEDRGAGIGIAEGVSCFCPGAKQVQKRIECFITSPLLSLFLIPFIDCQLLLLRQI